MPTVKYRRLKKGEVLRAGDEYLDPALNWCPSYLYGVKVYPGIHYRRPITRPRTRRKNK